MSIRPNVFRPNVLSVICLSVICPFCHLIFDHLSNHRPACVGGSNRQGNTNVDHSITLENHTLEEVTSFCYLGGMFVAEGGAERLVKMRVAGSRAKWREIVELLGMRGIPINKITVEIDACIRSVLLCTSETWSLTQSLESIMRSCETLM